MPKFEKREEELQGIVEKWAYFIKNAGDLSAIPAGAKEIPEPREAYEQASLFHWSAQELEIHEFWRMEETSDRYRLREEYHKGKSEGIAEGVATERLEMAARLRSLGTSTEIIRQVTGLSAEELEEQTHPNGRRVYAF